MLISDGRLSGDFRGSLAVLRTLPVPRSTTSRAWADQVNAASMMVIPAGVLVCFMTVKPLATRRAPYSSFVRWRAANRPSNERRRRSADRDVRNDRAMRVMGVDLAAKPEATGAVVLKAIDAMHWRAVELSGRPTDDALVSAAGQVDIIGVDSPLGWPRAFVEAVDAHHSFRPWPGGTDRSTLTHRDTDRAIRRHGVRAALSVSADKLGSVAMRCALLQQRWAGVWGHPAPRDGSGRLVETYPAAALTAWRVASAGYKDRRDLASARTVRGQIIRDVDAAVSGWLDLTVVSERCVESDHVLDALVSGLVAVAAAGGATHQPSDDERTAALIEGWIHVPSTALSAVRPCGPTRY